jgi:hypothetical protein
MIGRVIVGQIRERLHQRRERHRRRRLHFWLGLMAACERRQLTDCEAYQWFARKAMACNAGRRK